ncbi:3-carboxy-cis,cis-muconate cycloisomerase [Pelagibius sp. CAU 1746]|uniref:3-carboxy-cis,cis-muconate cycloisomerase n=1 Tax=Pelagibius sp. CAU 1746 TaxID=3140370 RepID=UPI00325A5E36
MSLLPFDSAFLGPLLSDAETAELLDDAAQIRAMLVFEAALARAEGRSGVIPEDAAARIAAVAEKLEIDPAALAEGTARDGIPVPALVAELRRALGREEAAYVHWGTTTQDVMDTGLVLRLRRILDIFDKRLAALGDRLAALAEAERATVMLARTRGQQATPTSFGLKAAGWLAPLDRHRARLAELRPRLEVLSFGGAAGNLSALGEQGTAVEAELAKELDLAAPPMPWHSQRDGLVELGNWLGLVGGSLGKLAGDVLLLCQNEVGELREGPHDGQAGGGSSTLPQKRNPVRSEAVLSLARHVAGLTGQMQQTAFHAQERDGVAWQMEWLVLPQMLVATGAALRQSLDLLAGLQVDRAKMRANIEATNGLALAEAASFALSAHMPRPEAQALVKEACKEAMASGRPLMEILAERTAAPVDWQALADPAAQLGAAETFIDRVLAARRD